MQAQVTTCLHHMQAPMRSLLHLWCTLCGRSLANIAVLPILVELQCPTQPSHVFKIEGQHGDFLKLK